MDNALERIYKAGLKFLVPLTPEETYATIVHEAVRLVGGNGGAIVLEEEGELKMVYRSQPAPPLGKIRKRGFNYTSFREHKSFVVHAKDIKRAHPEIAKAGIKSVLFIPLSYRNRSVGVLSVRSYKDKHFSKKEEDVLKLFGSMASLAIRKMQLYDEAKKAIEVRDLFLAMAAHEFRTPLTTISGYTQLLAGKFLKDHATQSRWIEEMLWEVSRLTSLVNELLEISRIKGGQFQYIWRECHISNVIERVIAEFQFNHADRKLCFDKRVKDGRDIVVGDFDKLGQVLANLLDNAAKFSSPDKEIRLTLDFRSPNLVITVKDLGMGIEDKDLSRVFEGFYRGNKVAGEGMGIGLFLAKNIIAQHHGVISIKSKVGKGTKVEVKLPRIKV